MQNSTSVTPYMSSNLREYNRIYKEVNDIYRETAARFGLSNSAFDILYTICEVGDGCLQRDVCDATFIPKQTVHSSIRKLEQEGYLTLSSGKGRSKHIHLTESGHILLKETIFPIVEAENEAFLELSQEECKLLLKLHGKYVLLYGISFPNFNIQDFSGFFRIFDRIFCYHYLRKDLFYANSIIRTFYLQKASAFCSAFYYHDDFYFHLQCGRRAFCIKLCW